MCGQNHLSHYLVVTRKRCCTSYDFDGVSVYRSHKDLSGTYSLSDGETISPAQNDSET